jgi:hypothetical protein
VTLLRLGVQVEVDADGLAGRGVRELQGDGQVAALGMDQVTNVGSAATSRGR